MHATETEDMLRIEGLRRVFGTHKDSERVVAVDDLSLGVAPGQFFTLLGPSGCGKTTTLRAIAGLERPDEGEIRVDGVTLFSSKENIDLEAHRRNLGMVFQSYAIWPHMTVRQNVMYPLVVRPRAQRPPREEITRRVRRILDEVQLGEVIDRPATDLSGGQQQRLALARALVAAPPLLLLDEPLSNLDAQLREEMRSSLRHMQREFGITTIYVTHDQAEALAMSDAIAVMDQGRIEQLGPPEDVYGKPASRFVAEFIGTANFLKGRVVERDRVGFRVSTEVGELVATSKEDLSPGDSVVVSIRPEGIDLEVPERSDSGAVDAVGTWTGTVRTRAFLGESVEHLVEVGDAEILVRCHQSVNIPTGTRVSLNLRTSACTLVPQ